MVTELTVPDHANNRAVLGGAERETTVHCSRSALYYAPTGLDVIFLTNATCKTHNENSLIIPTTPCLEHDILNEHNNIIFQMPAFPSSLL